MPPQRSQSKTAEPAERMLGERFAERAEKTTLRPRRLPQRSPRLQAQASIEMTLGLLAALLLLLGSFKVFLWMNERLVTRQMQYENSRVQAASGDADAARSRAYEPTKPLRVLSEE